MKKYGFEREYWVVNEISNEASFAPIQFGHDECGYLCEARGEAHTDVVVAAHLLLAEEQKLCKQVAGLKTSLILQTTPSSRVLNPQFLRSAWKTFGKNRTPPEQGNIYGFDYKATNKWRGAGLHVHFSDTRDIIWSERVKVCGECGNEKELSFKTYVPQQQDIPKIVKALDRRFKPEILDAHRLPGFYEIKPWGFEYRSLPASVDPTRVAEVILEEKL